MDAQWGRWRCEYITAANCRWYSIIFSLLISLIADVINCGYTILIVSRQRNEQLTADFSEDSSDSASSDFACILDIKLLDIGFLVHDLYCNSSVQLRQTITSESWTLTQEERLKFRRFERKIQD